MTAFQEKLLKLEQILQKINPAILGYLGNPMSEAEVRAAFEGIEYAPTPEMIDFYMWHSGADDELPTGLLHFVENTFFFPISYVKRIYDRWQKDTFHKNMRPSLVPLGWEYDLFIELDKISHNYGFLYIIPKDKFIYEPISIFDSFYSFLDTVIKCFEEGLYFYDEEGYFNCDFAYEEIAKALNPQSVYWQLEPNEQGLYDL